MKNTNQFNRHTRVYIYVLVLVSSSAFQPVLGEIKNGYENELPQLKASLKNLHAILNQGTSLSGQQRKNIETKIESMENSIHCYTLTENLLDQFKTIAPDLYAEIDSIKDTKGRSVNVYIKFIPQDATAVKAWGTTYIDQMANDSDGYQSEYGELSVSVKIWIVGKALLVLSHELGHVKHQVPHLASYVDYYKMRYTSVDSHDLVGHDPNDPSGRSAVQFEKRFQKQYANYLKISDAKLQNPLVLMDKIRKERNTDI